MMIDFFLFVIVYRRNVLESSKRIDSFNDHLLPCKNHDTRASNRYRILFIFPLSIASVMLRYTVTIIQSCFEESFRLLAYREKIGKSSSSPR